MVFVSLAVRLWLRMADGLLARSHLLGGGIEFRPRSDPPLPSMRNENPAVAGEDHIPLPRPHSTHRSVSQALQRREPSRREQDAALCRGRSTRPRWCVRM